MKNLSEDMRELYEEIESYPALISDLDHTLISTRSEKGIGYGFLKKALMCKKYGHFLQGFCNTMIILAGTKFHLKDEMWGLKRHYKSMGDSKFCDKESAENFAMEYIKRKELPGARDFIKSLPQKYKVLITRGSEIGARAAKEYFGFDAYAANPVIYDGELIKDCKVEIANGKDRLKKAKDIAEKLGVSLEKCVVIGDDGSDLDIMRTSGLSIAGPHANEKVIDAADIYIDNYNDFNHKLKKV